ncbi:unnamed protein product [Lymnaea stagnalis]|uniref:G-protein coupled receptors family 1 profile domain-containing protein n=1 Tax=Lymnaea stagnalis TaxID=6523 RepID=A0AAV2I0A2_LYMST
MSYKFTRSKYSSCVKTNSTMHDRETPNAEQDQNSTMYLFGANPEFYQNFSFYDEPNEILELTTLASSGILVAGVFFNITAIGVFSSAVFHKMSFTVHMKIICCYNIAVLCLGMIRHQSFMLDVPGHAKPDKRHLLCLQVLWFFHVFENSRSVSIALLLYNRIRAQRQTDSHHKSIMALRLPLLMNTASFLLMVMPVSTYITHYRILSTHFNRTECVFAFLRPFNLDIPADLALSNGTIVEEGLNVGLLLVLILEIFLRHWRQKKAFARQKGVAKDSSSEELMMRLSNLRFSIISKLSKVLDDPSSPSKRYDSSSKMLEAHLPEKRTHSPMPQEKPDAVEQWPRETVRHTPSNKEMSVYSTEHRASTAGLTADDGDRETTGRDTMIFAASPRSNSLSGSPDVTVHNLFNVNKRREALRARDNGATRMSVAVVTLHILTAVPRRVQHSSLLSTYIPAITAPSFPVLALMDMIMLTYQAVMFVVFCAFWKLYRKEAYKLLFETDDDGLSDFSFPYTSLVISRLLRRDEEGASQESFQARRRKISRHNLPKLVKALDKNSTITNMFLPNNAAAADNDAFPQTTRRRSLIHDDQLSTNNQISTNVRVSVKGWTSTKEQLFDQASIKSQKPAHHELAIKDEITTGNQIKASSIKAQSPDRISAKDPNVMRANQRDVSGRGKEFETISLSSKATSRGL